VAILRQMPTPRRPSLVYSLIGVLSWPLLKVLYRLRAHGIENLPASGGFVLAANHVSNFDPWPLGVPLFPGRYLRFMGKSELFWPPLGWLIGSAGAFKVRRGQRDTEAIATAVELVREGHVVVMFPEGTRQRKGIVKKHVARPRTGAARIAIEGGVPLVPAAIVGTDRLSRLGALRVVYGQPLAPEGTPQELTDKLMAEIDRLHATL
jgi:1-acyl-sn-glycerol-3-phosphate acyltransferase